MVSARKMTKPAQQVDILNQVAKRTLAACSNNNTPSRLLLMLSYL